MNITTLAKNLATILGTASVLVYAWGYLALRARAYALGTERSFNLVDEVYIFAGYRVLFMTLLFLLLTAPLLVALRIGAEWGVRILPNPVQWIIIVVLAVATLAALGIFTVDSVLLRDQDAPETALMAAVLGKRSELRLALVAGLTLLIAFTSFWLHARTGAPPSMYQISILAVLLAIQVMLLPIYHGALFADRRARILSEMPDTVKGMEPPLAIVDQTGEQVTLLGTDGRGTLGLVAVSQSELHGIPVREVTSLARFVNRLSMSDGDAAGLALTPVAAEQTNGADTVLGGDLLTETKKEQGSAWTFFLDYLGIVIDAIGSLGDNEQAAGTLWVAELDHDGHSVGTQQIGMLTDLSWPVADSRDGYLALQRGHVVRLDASGALVEVLEDQADWRQLIGVDANGSALGLIRDGATTRFAVLSPEGAVQRAAGEPDEEERRAVAVLTSNARAYSGGRVLGVDRSGRSGRGFDVYLKSPSGRSRITDCDPDACVQPSPAPDFRRIVYVRVPRF